MLKQTLWFGILSTALLGTATARADDQTSPVLPRHEGMFRMSEYWLGAHCVPTSEPLRAHLNLSQGEGLLVLGVVPDSPAAKAGIKRLDVLLKAGGKPLGKVQDLVGVIDAANGEKVTMALIRGGTKQQLEATPVKRPSKARAGDVPGTPGDDDWERARKWLERFMPEDGENWRDPVRFHIFHPGAILPGWGTAHPPLPADMTVTITKSGDKPAQITVQRNGKNWETTEKELDKLPADVRPHVERMLGRLPVAARIFEGEPQQPSPTTKDRPARGAPEGRMERRINELSRRLEQLRRAVDELRSGRQEADGSAEGE